jgi:hypothetical protein
MAFIQENHITCLKKRPPRALPETNPAFHTKMQHINQKRQTQISDEHETHSTESKRIHKITQTG